jgi:hypothetical protein
VDLLTDEDTRPKAMEIISSLIDRIQLGAPEERGPYTVTLIGRLASVLAFASEQEDGTAATAGAIQAVVLAKRGRPFRPPIKGAALARADRVSSGKMRASRCSRD